MMKKLAIAAIAASLTAFVVSLPPSHAAPAATTPVNPQGVLKPDPFADVPPDHWAYNAVEYLRQQGLMEGYPDKTFRGKRPLTRYEFAQTIARMIQGIVPRIQALEKGTGPGPMVDLQPLRDQIAALQNEVNTLKGQMANAATKDQITDLQNQIDALKKQLTEIKPGGLTREEVQNMINAGNFATTAQLDTLQKLVNEFRNELSRLGVDVDALKKQMAELRDRVAAIEEYLRRMPVIHGDANIIAKTSWESTQMRNPVTGALRPAFDQDMRPVKATTDVLKAASAEPGAGGAVAPGVPGTVPGRTATVLPYYDLDLGVFARPTSNVLVGAVVNVGNYQSSYPFHGYNAAGPAVVTPYKLYVNVPFRFLGSDEITVGRFGTQMTPYTFKAIDPDVYTYLPREDSGEVVMWGADTTWRFGTSRLHLFAGVDPLDGRLLPLNTYQQFVGFAGGVPTYVANPVLGGGRTGGLPITQISNVVGARLAFGQSGAPAMPVSELPIGTPEQYNMVPPPGPAPVAAEAAAPAPGAAAPEAPAKAAVPEGTINFGPLRNVIVGLNWLMATGDQPAAVEDSRAQIMGADTNFKIGPVAIQAEADWAISDTGGIARPRALKDSAIDARGFWNIPLGKVADLQIGGGYRRITLGYLVPGYWGIIGSWKDPRGIKGPLAEIRVPVKQNVASFLRNMELRASAEFYEGTENVPTVGAGFGTDPSETNLKIDRYVAGVSFGLTSRDKVDLGVEQVFRNYFDATGVAVPLSLPTMGVGGMPLVGTRIKNTETYINFGVGHNFTPDVAVKLLYQLVDFSKFAVDNSNQPASYRGYVVTGQVGVRF